MKLFVRIFGFSFYREHVYSTFINLKVFFVKWRPMINIFVLPTKIFTFIFGCFVCCLSQSSWIKSIPWTGKQQNVVGGSTCQLTNVSISFPKTHWTTYWNNNERVSLLRTAWCEEFNLSTSFKNRGFSPLNMLFKRTKCGSLIERWLRALQTEMFNRGQRFLEVDRCNPQIPLPIFTFLCDQPPSSGCFAGALFGQWPGISRTCVYSVVEHCGEQFQKFK